MPSGQAPIPSGVSAEARHTYSLRTRPIIWQKCSVWDGLWKRCQDLPIHGKGTWLTSCIKTGTLGIFPDFMELLISQIGLPSFFNPTVWHAKFLSIRPTVLCADSGRLLVTFMYMTRIVLILQWYIIGRRGQLLTPSFSACTLTPGSLLPAWMQRFLVLMSLFMQPWCLGAASCSTFKVWKQEDLI